MKVRFVNLRNNREGNPVHVAQIDNARITYRNFRGVGSPFNREGERNFSLIIPDQGIADAFLKDVSKYGDSWNVKIKAPREEGDTPWIHLPVKVKFNGRGPNIYLKTGHVRRKLDEDSVGILDNIDILNIDMDITASDKEVNGKSYRTAYLRSMEVTQEIDRFEERYAEESMEEE